MRVALLVGEGVVAAVVGDPVQDRALHRHAAHDGQADAQRAPGLEGAVREVPMEAHRRAETRHRVERHRQDDVQPGQPPAPGERHGGQQRQERDDDERVDRDLRRYRALAAEEGLHRRGHGRTVAAGHGWHPAGRMPAHSRQMT
jgi:hypothetical protein